MADVYYLANTCCARFDLGGGIVRAHMSFRENCVLDPSVALPKILGNVE